MDRALQTVDRRPRRFTVACALAAGVVGGTAAGPVAAAIAAVYLGCIAAAWIGRRRSRLAGQRWREVLDGIGMVAADLRAGLTASAALAAALPLLDAQPGNRERHGRRSAVDRPTDRAMARLAAAWQLSEQLGAPLADLLDRIESDLRASDRVRLTVAAQTAGARATTWLLASLPVVGVAVGFSMGVDPVHALLHTRVGAACALAALAFQAAGVGWSVWLTRVTVGEGTR